MALTKQEKTDIVNKFAQAKGDTGSPEIQVAILSLEVEKLQQHLDENKHDSPAKKRNFKQNFQTSPSSSLSFCSRC